MMHGSVAVVSQEHLLMEDAVSCAGFESVTVVLGASLVVLPSPFSAFFD
jgi:hypothetical protein